MGSDELKYAKTGRYDKQISVFKNILQKYSLGRAINWVLDVGCGNGIESVKLSKTLKCNIVGIDTEDSFDPEALNQVDLINYNGEKTDFPDNVFDGVYSFHVLEHAQKPDSVIGEIARVLKTDGFAFIGVPNKKRWVAYLSMEGKSLRRRIGQNLKDYSMRLRGRFENRYGAHAGFTENELLQKLSDRFSKSIVVTRDYYRIKWAHRKWLVSFILALRLDKFFFPSVYILSFK